MKRKLKFLYPLFAFLIYSAIGFSQTNFSLRVKPIGFTPVQNINAEIFTLKADPGAHLLFEPGIILAYEKYIIEDQVAVKINQGVYLDATAGASGMSAVNLQFRIQKKRSLAYKKKAALNLGIGFGVLYRNSWSRLEGYVKERFVYTNDNFQYLFLPYIDLGYDIYKSQTNDLSFGLLYGYPNTANLYIGWKYWFARTDCHCK
ncbi:MAG: hypothetical protein C0594_00910 [Marinilabiliales bacterium]|nr:MAG: hypothetical protein C0594_00910 [Marinilabiliales bacterium]